jgi:hypothetical protein
VLIEPEISGFSINLSDFMGQLEFEEFFGFGIFGSFSSQVDFLKFSNHFLA